MKSALLTIALVLMGCLLVAQASFTNQSIERSREMEDGGKLLISYYYPVFAGDSPLAKALNDYVCRALNSDIAYMDDSGSEDRYTDYEALAESVFDAWAVDYPEWAAFFGSGDWEESISVRVMLNKGITTLGVEVYSFTGGAHGNSYTEYRMYDPSGNVLQGEDLIKPDRLASVYPLLDKYFKVDVAEAESFERDYIHNPGLYALIDVGLLAMYEGRFYAEGTPTLVIPMAEVKPLLRQQVLDWLK